MSALPAYITLSHEKRLSDISMTYIKKEWILECLREWEDNAKAGENTEDFVKAIGFVKRFVEGCRPYGDEMIEVVRCENCAHRREDEDFVSGHYCVKHPSNGGYFCDNGDFCSYGKLKAALSDGKNENRLYPKE